MAAPAANLPTKLNFGCGWDYREGWWNVDLLDYERLDQRLDFLRAPWDLPANHFEHALASHVLEHVPPLAPDGRDGLLVVLAEMYRILRPGGTFEIVGPHPAMGLEDYFGSPTHYRVIGEHTFEYFRPGYAHHLSKEAPVRFEKVSYEVTKRLPVARRFLRLGKSRLGLTQHLALRAPFLRPLLNRVPWELRIVLRKV